MKDCGDSLIVKQGSFQTQDGSASPTSPLQFNKREWQVLPCDKKETYPWILKKHYAHRLPPIIFAFGLYKNKNLQGICTFGMPCVQMNMGKCVFENYQIETIELNRLVINENLPKNILSFFISKTFKFLSQPICIVSFADPNNGHRGYIYQATNWIYTGLSEKGGKNKDFILNGRNYHGKTINEKWFKDNNYSYDTTKLLTENFERIGGEIRDFGLKHRYFKLLGNKKQIEEMKKHFVYRIFPYPKGDNKRYDASFKPETQGILF